MSENLYQQTENIGVLANSIKVNEDADDNSDEDSLTNFLNNDDEKNNEEKNNDDDITKSIENEINELSNNINDEDNNDFNKINNDDKEKNNDENDDNDSHISKLSVNDDEDDNIREIKEDLDRFRDKEKEMNDLEEYENATPEYKKFLKFRLINKMADLSRNKGVIFTQNYNLNSDYMTMKAEYDYQVSLTVKKQAVKNYYNILMTVLKGLEYGNKRFDPLGIDLDGLANNVEASKEELIDALGDFYNEHNSSMGTASPVVRIGFIIIQAAVMTMITNASSKYIMNMFSNNSAISKLEQEAMSNTMSGNKTKYQDETKNEYNTLKENIKNRIEQQNIQQNQQQNNFNNSSSSLQQNNLNNNLNNNINNGFMTSSTPILKKPQMPASLQHLKI